MSQEAVLDEQYLEEDKSLVEQSVESEEDENENIDETEEKVVSFPEAFVVVSFVAIAEIFEIIFAITIVGIIFSEIINFAVGVIVWMWLYFKGGSNTSRRVITYWVGVVADAIFGGVLPIKTIGIIMLIYSMNNPKVGQVVDIASKIK